MWLAKCPDVRDGDTLPGFSTAVPALISANAASEVFADEAVPRVGDNTLEWCRRDGPWRTHQPYTGYEAMEMQLDPREASLVEVFRRLPPDTAAELSALAERLATLSPHRRLDWSDSWTDEDLQDFRAASLRRLEAEESEESH